MKELAPTHKHKTSHADYQAILTESLNMNPFYLKKKMFSVYFIAAICYFMNRNLFQLQGMLMTGIIPKGRLFIQGQYLHAVSTEQGNSYHI